MLELDWKLAKMAVDSAGTLTKITAQLDHLMSVRQTMVEEEVDTRLLDEQVTSLRYQQTIYKKRIQRFEERWEQLKETLEKE